MTAAEIITVAAITLAALLVAVQMVVAVAYPINTYDAAILVAYLILFAVKRDFRVFLCMTPLFAYYLTFEIGKGPIDTYAYTFYSGINITLSYYFIKRKYFIISIPIITMASYNLLFAFDSFYNSEYETWIWRNHEIIICILHAFIMLVFVEKFTAVVDACITHVNVLRNNRPSNVASTSNAGRKSSEARNK